MSRPGQHGEKRTFVDGLIEFVRQSPTSFHAAQEVADRLRTAGFFEQKAAEPWASGPRARYVVDDGTVIAWLTPPDWDPMTGFRIVGAHTDSPTLKIKPIPDTGRAGWKQLAVEPYGGILLNSWLDRDLGVAGRLVTRDGTSTLVRTTEPLLRVAQLAYHLNPTVNEAGLSLDKQEHMQPIWGLGVPVAGEFVEYMAVLAGLAPTDVVGFDLSTFDTLAPSTLGHDRELLAAARLDNLSSVYAGLQALLATAREQPPRTCAVFAAFDHEEVGSGSRTGAGGPMLEQALDRIMAAEGIGFEMRTRAMAQTRMLSADALHAVHPNYLQASDPLHHAVPNAGPALKVNARQRYTSDGRGQAVWTRACEAAAAPHQTFVSHNEIPCGSTIGPITATRLGILVLDVGVPVLSLHSARELCGVRDPQHLASAAHAFLQDPRPH